MHGGKTGEMPVEGSYSQQPNQKNVFESKFMIKVRQVSEYSVFPIFKNMLFEQRITRRYDSSNRRNLLFYHIWLMSEAVSQLEQHTMNSV
jgi:hypothetical protein